MSISPWWKPMQLRLGKFKMPFSLEELTSSNYIDFQERSFANALAPAKLTGAMLHGVPVKGLYYGLALTNGSEDLEVDTTTPRTLSADSL
jgi:phosphate-selective porin OprO/OprP